MPGTVPDKLKLYRITDYRNLDFILKHGLHCPSKTNDPNYVCIGNNDIIEKRGKSPVPIEPFGALHDYVAFYFAPKSPMLYSIKHSGNQSEIIYLVSSFEKIEENNVQYVFTNGHALQAISSFYNRKDDFDRINWDIINATYWFDSNEYPDRKRQRMAEFLVFKYLPIGCLIEISTKNKKAFNFVNEILDDFNVRIPTFIKPQWYY